ncbi:SGNH/GDSL hydrolase family protein [bacterium]|nr:SGNH/GDSL hydrolase family protein [bacterium]
MKNGLFYGTGFNEKNTRGRRDDDAARQAVEAGEVPQTAGHRAKARRGEKITIGVIGGSITEAGPAIPPPERYGGILQAWWQKAFANALVDLINAGVGATRSDYGALRVQRDLLRFKPDLVVLEFAVNDPPTREYAESYEGMVRQILTSAHTPALVLLFMTQKNRVTAQVWEQKIGAHYQLMMISYHEALWHELRAGRLTWDQFYPDHVHPNPAGHSLVGTLLTEAMERALEPFNPPPSPTAVQPLPVPLISAVFENTLFLDAQDMIPSVQQGWTFDRSGKEPAGWRCATPGSIIEFEISGQQLYLLFWKVNGPMGQVRATVDGRNPIMLDAWFEETWGGYPHMERISGILQQSNHVLRIELLSDKNQQSTGNEFRLLCIGSTLVRV